MPRLESVLILALCAFSDVSARAQTSPSDPPPSPLPAYANLRIAQNPPLISAPLIDAPGTLSAPNPPAQPLSDLESLPPPTENPVESSWPAFDVGPVRRRLPGSENGTNPAVNIRNWRISDEIVHYKDVGPGNTASFRLLYPFDHGRGGLGFRLPYVYVDPTFTDAQGGFADLKLDASYNFYADPSATWTYMPSIELYIPTNDEDWASSNLLTLKVGYRRFVVGPGLTLVWAPADDTFVAWSYGYRFDIAGNDGHPVSVSTFQSVLMHEWENGAYIMPGYGYSKNHDNDGSASSLSTQFGMNVNTVTVSLTPGINLNPTWGSFEWGIALGCRVVY